MNAASLSRALHDAGFRPLPSGTPITREGIRVKRASAPYFAYVVVDLDGPAARARISDDLADVLAELPGVVVERKDEHRFLLKNADADTTRPPALVVEALGKRASDLLADLTADETTDVLGVHIGPMADGSCRWHALVTVCVGDREQEYRITTPALGTRVPRWATQYQQWMVEQRVDDAWLTLDAAEQSC